MSENKSFNGVKQFHEAFGHPVGTKPTAIPVETAVKRAVWTAEEVVEFLHASVGGNENRFKEVVGVLMNGIDTAVKKQLAEGEYTNKSNEEIVIRQADALTDISYFNYGSFVVAGVDPQPLFDIVQEANMGKLDRATGKPIIRESDGKIMKPDYWEAEFAPEPRLREEIKRQMDADSNEPLYAETVLRSEPLTSKEDEE
jgi:predicted HAD superfamily Cof-like phosphohydrolase